MQPENPASSNISWTLATALLRDESTAEAQPSRGLLQHISANTSFRSPVADALELQLRETLRQAVAARSRAWAAVAPYATELDTSLFGNNAAQRRSCADAIPMAVITTAHATTQIAKIAESRIVRPR